MSDSPSTDDHRVIFDSSPAIIFYKDRHNRILRCNLAAARSIGRTVAECEGASTYDLYPAEDAAKYYDDDMQVINSGEPKLGIVEPYMAGDEARWVRTDKIPYRNSQGEIIGVIVFALDITDQKRAEIKLHDAMLEAEQANRAKSNFLANVSHEIRTPLGIILGFADLLRAKDVDQEQRTAYAEKILKSGKRLLGLVNEILDLSKIERGRIAIEPVSFVLTELVHEAMTNVEAKAAAKHVRLELHIDERVPKNLITDPARLRQILVNLLDNAVKFTDEGQVTLSVDLLPSSTPQPDGIMSLSFTVEDQGCGIAANQAKDLFKPFFQGDASMARLNSGVGLGLALSRQLAKHLGGDVILSASTPGVGSRFTATIKVREGSPFVVPVGSVPPKLRPGRVLLVEDHPDIREMLISYLAGTPLKVLVCTDGHTAITMAAHERPDAILMDLQLPEMDGISAVKAIRANGYKGPIIAVSAHAMKGTREECLKVGFTDFLAKPVDRNNLLRTLSDRLTV